MFTRSRIGTNKIAAVAHVIVAKQMTAGRKSVVKPLHGSEFYGEGSSAYMCEVKFGRNRMCKLMK